MQPLDSVVHRLREVDRACVLERLDDAERDESSETLTVRWALVESDTVRTAVRVCDGLNGRRAVVLQVVERHDAALGLHDCKFFGQKI